MKPIDQTLFGGADHPPEQRGDCYSACLASIFEIPLSEVPHFTRAETIAETLAWEQRWLADQGYMVIQMEPNEDWEMPEGLIVVATGMGPRTHRHAVVWKTGRGMIHDPHLSRDGLLDEPDWYDVFVALDPSRLVLAE